MPPPDALGGNPLQEPRRTKTSTGLWVLLGLLVLVAAVGIAVSRLNRPVDPDSVKGQGSLKDPSADALAKVRTAKTSEDLVAGLKHTDQRVRLAAAERLSSTPDIAETCVPALAEATSDANDEVRIAAIRACGQLRDKAVAAVPALVRCLRKGPYPVAWNALSALGSIGSGAHTSTAELLSIAADLPSAIPDPAIRSSDIVRTIKTFGASAVPHLATGLASDNPAVRTVSAEVLASLAWRGQTPGVVDLLLSAATDPNPKVRLEAVKGLTEVIDPISPNSADDRLLPALLSRLTDEDEIKFKAQEGLARLGPRALNRLAQEFERAPLPTRRVLAQCLNQFNSNKSEALRLAIPLLADRDVEVRTAAARVVSRFAQEFAAADAVPGLTTMVTAADERERRAACEALAALGSRARAGLPVLLERFAAVGVTEDERARLAEVIDGIDPKAKDADAALARFAQRAAERKAEEARARAAQDREFALWHAKQDLKSFDTKTRAGAVATLASLGTPEALEALRGALRDEFDPELRQKIRVALALPKDRKD